MSEENQVADAPAEEPAGQAPSVAEMAPVSREPTYATPSNYYYGNENQVRRN